jgi:hypothetical protein
MRYFSETEPIYVCGGELICASYFCGAFEFLLFSLFWIFSFFLTLHPFSALSIYRASHRRIVARMMTLVTIPLARFLGRIGPFAALAALVAGRMVQFCVLALVATPI